MRLSEATRDTLARAINKIDVDLGEARARQKSLEQQLEATLAGIETLESRKAAIQKDLT